MLCHKRTNKKGDIIDDDVDVFQDALEGARLLFGDRILICNMLRQFFSRWIEIGKPRNRCSSKDALG